MKELQIPTDKITALRKDLHRNPEVSGNEKNTAKTIHRFISEFNPDEVIKGLGRTGMAFIYKGEAEGPTLMFRCELDALPIKEINDFRHRSGKQGVSHKCGHDGHMSIIAGIAATLGEKRPKKGRIILLFQPAEEIGEGANWILEDKKFKNIEPDYIYALHNLPGYPSKEVIIRNGVFAAASKGMVIKLKGKTSHAGEPENGISPAKAVSHIIRKLEKLPEVHGFKDYTLVTVVHAKLGEIAFGTSPGYAEVRATLRAYLNEDIDKLSEQAEKMVRKIASEENLKVELEWVEEFSSTYNDENCVKTVEKAAKNTGASIAHPEKPFNWSEDFGHFTKKYKGVLFGLGSGESHPKLHNPDYDFPDEIAETGIKIFLNIIEQHLEIPEN